MESLYAEANEPPLTIRRHTLSLQYAAKIGANPNNLTYSYTFCDYFHFIFYQQPNLSTSFSKRIIDFNFPKSISNKVNYPPPWAIKIPKCNTNLLLSHKFSTPFHPILQTVQEIKKKYKSHYQIYTDASKSSQIEAGGAASVDETSTYQFQLPKEYSIYSAELLAIYKALQHILQQYKSKAVIFTGSLSVLQGILRVYPNHPMLCQIKTDLEALHNMNKQV